MIFWPPLPNGPQFLAAFRCGSRGLVNEVSRTGLVSHNHNPTDKHPPGVGNLLLLPILVPDVQWTQEITHHVIGDCNPHRLAHVARVPEMQTTPHPRKLDLFGRV